MPVRTLGYLPYGISIVQFVAFGINHKDFSMQEGARLGMLMGQSNDAIKASIKAVIGDNEALSIKRFDPRSPAEQGSLTGLTSLFCPFGTFLS
ncbi:MAG: HAD hydrolase family protein [Sodalis sp. (in: enterobacteria)]